MIFALGIYKRYDGTLFAQAPLPPENGWWITWERDGHCFEIFHARGIPEIEWQGMAEIEISKIVGKLRRTRLTPENVLESSPTGDTR